MTTAKLLVLGSSVIFWLIRSQFLEIQRLQLAGSSSTVFAVNLVLCLKGNRKGIPATRDARKARSLALKFPSLPFRTPATHTKLSLASHADILLARHTISHPSVGKERMTKLL